NQAAADLDNHAAAIERIFAEAGISSGAPGTLRHVASWVDYRRRDLQKRVDKIVGADSGAAPGFRFANPAQAGEAGAEEAKKIRGLLKKGDFKGAEAELAKVRQYASDPNYDAAFVRELGPRYLAKLANKIWADAGHSNVLHDLAPLGQILATLSKQKDNLPPGQKDGIP